MLTLAVPLPLLIAEIDLSIASNPGFSCVVGAMLISRHAPWWLGMLVGVGVRTLIGFLNGVCMTWPRMVSLIETLAMMIIFQGVLLAITHGNTITDLPNGLFRAGQTTLLGWPLLPLMFVLALVGMVGFLCLTIIGGNPLAAVSVGIRVRRIKILAFTPSGFLSSIAGYLLASWQMAITSNQGSGFLSYAIAAPISAGSACRDPRRAVDPQRFFLPCRHDRRICDLHRRGDGRVARPYVIGALIACFGEPS